MTPIPMVKSCSSQHYDVIIYLEQNDGGKNVVSPRRVRHLRMRQHFNGHVNFGYRSVSSGRKCDSYMYSRNETDVTQTLDKIRIKKA